MKIIRLFFLIYLFFVSTNSYSQHLNRKVKVVNFSFSISETQNSCDYSYLIYNDRLYPFSIIEEKNHYNYFSDCLNKDGYHKMVEISVYLRNRYEKDNIPYRYFKYNTGEMGSYDIYVKTYELEVDDLLFYDCKIDKKYEILYESECLVKNTVILPLRISKITPI